MRWLTVDANELDRIRRERTAATAAIVESDAEKKLVVAGPGTGKTFTFRKALEACAGEGLALTFIRNLVRDLDEALGAIAGVFTFHGFCKHQLHRNPVEGLRKNWHYYPPLMDLISYDLDLMNGPSPTYRQIERALHALDDGEGFITAALDVGNYYNAVAHTDLVYRVLRHFEHHEEAIPEYPLIVVDEYQDFSLLETSFIALLATRSRVLIAGDDDQALYAFKSASPRFIRELAHEEQYEQFPLPYCSRCTKVIVDAVNDALRAAVEAGNLVGRLDKPFECFVPDKLADSEAHPEVIHAHCTVERNNAPYVGRYVTEQIDAIPDADIEEAAEQGYPTALVIGPNPFLERAYQEITNRFPSAELKTATQVETELLDGYRLLVGDESSRLGWRIILACEPCEGMHDLVATALSAGEELSEAVPGAYRARHLDNARLLRALIDDELEDAELERLCRVVGRSVAEIREHLALGEKFEEEPDPAEEAPPKDPEPSDDPTIVCTSLVGAKGLSAGYVYIVGFNNGHFPRDPRLITDDEVCAFLVGLSRTRKECHVVSCGRLGNQSLRVSAFAAWIARHTRDIKVDAAYFR
jgi:superfamily I DNA/RNA helicase